MTFKKSGDLTLFSLKAVISWEIIFFPCFIFVPFFAFCCMRAQNEIDLGLFRS